MDILLYELIRLRVRLCLIAKDDHPLASTKLLSLQVVHLVVPLHHHAGVAVHHGSLLDSIISTLCQSCLASQWAQYLNLTQV